MKKVIIIGLEKKKEIFDFISSFKKYNIDFDCFIRKEKDFELYDKINDQNIDIKNYICAISLGGDGTFLYTSRIFAGSDIPVFGVNFGRLGFNTTIEVKDFYKIFDNFLKGKVDYEYKKLLDVEIQNQDKIYSVLNEGVISHTGISRMIRLRVELEGDPIYDFRGDGLIVSTPTGSTAYNLSAGGPILHPLLDAYVISPICPHTLAIRPYIIPFSKNIVITVEESSTQSQITLDGQKIIFLNTGQKIVFKKSEKSVKVVKGLKNFSEILKDKLGWIV